MSSLFPAVCQCLCHFSLHFNHLLYYRFYFTLVLLLLRFCCYCLFFYLCLLVLLLLIMSIIVISCINYYPRYSVLAPTVCITLYQVNKNQETSTVTTMNRRHTSCRISAEILAVRPYFDLIPKIAFRLAFKHYFVLICNYSKQ